VGALVRELFSVSLYKRSQGRLARQATFAALAVIVFLGAWSLHLHYKGTFFNSQPAAEDGAQQTPAETAEAGTTGSTSGSTKEFVFVYVLPFALLVSGVWASFRAVQLPGFADFLISVEGEMNKVSWPARDELFRASVVVMFVIFFLAGILFFYDLALTELMRFIQWFLNKISSVLSGLLGG
jgi:preprotein translocase subunit SecE